MTAVETTLKITCPEWCTTSPQEHADALWDMGGDCIHHASELKVTDPAGYREAFEEPKPFEPVTVGFTSSTNPEGRETASPVFYVEGHDVSLEQALAVAEAIQRAVATYRGER